MYVINATATFPKIPDAIWDFADRGDIPDVFRQIRFPFQTELVAVCFF